METLFWIMALSLPIFPNLWCIWHARRHAFPFPGEQQRWIRAGICAPIIGGILYLAIGMRRARPFSDENAVPGTGNRAGSLIPEPAMKKHSASHGARPEIHNDHQ